MTASVRLVCVFAGGRIPRTSPLFMSHCDGLTSTRLLNNHDPVHVTRFLCLTDTVRLFRGSAAFRPAFAPRVSRLATVSARSSERFLTRLASHCFLLFPFLCLCLWAFLWGWRWCAWWEKRRREERKEGGWGGREGGGESGWVGSGWEARGKERERGWMDGLMDGWMDGW